MTVAEFSSVPSSTDRGRLTWLCPRDQRQPRRLLSPCKCQVQNRPGSILAASSSKIKALGSGSLPFHFLPYFFNIFSLFSKGEISFATLLFRQLYSNLATKPINEVALSWSFLRYIQVSKDAVQLKTDINQD